MLKEEDFERGPGLAPQSRCHERYVTHNLHNSHDLTSTLRALQKLVSAFISYQVQLKTYFQKSFL